MNKQIILLGFILGIAIIVGCVQETEVEEQYCTVATGEKLGLSEAKQIAMDSECSEGSLTDESFCNEDTGTWWLDLDLEREGCNPACVVNVETKTAGINWRCTGALP